MPSNLIGLMDVSRITTGSSNTVDSKEIGEYPFFDRSQTIKRSDKYLFDSEAIIVPGEGSDFIPRYFKGKFDLHQRAYALFPRENIDGKYLYYAILNSKKHFSQVATGSTVKSLRLKSFELLKIPYVDADIQIRISTILSSIDDKIAINKQINANLSNQARVAFSSLLETADLSKAVLSEVADITMGQSPPGESLSEDCAGTLFYQGRAEFGEIFPTPRLYTSEPKRMASKGSVLMSVRAPVGDINLALDECCIGRGLSSIQSNEGLSGYVHYLMDYLKPQLDIFNGDGTVFGSINKESVNNLEILIPSKEDREKFDKLAAAIDAIIELNHREILKLQEFRDYLLPKLMSGEIDVYDLPLPN